MLRLLIPLAFLFQATALANPKCKDPYPGIRPCNQLRTEREDLVRESTALGIQINGCMAEVDLGASLDVIRSCNSLTQTRARRMQEIEAIDRTLSYRCEYEKRCGRR